MIISPDTFVRDGDRFNAEVRDEMQYRFGAMMWHFFAELSIEPVPFANAFDFVFRALPVDTQFRVDVFPILWDIPIRGSDLTWTERRAHPRLLANSEDLAIAVGRRSRANFMRNVYCAMAERLERDGAMEVVAQLANPVRRRLAMIERPFVISTLVWTKLAARVGDGVFLTNHGFRVLAAHNRELVDLHLV